MILDNRTRYRSSDLEAIVLLALREAGVTAHARDRVLVSYSSRGLSGWCYYGAVTPPKFASGTRKPRMTLRMPDPGAAPFVCGTCCGLKHEWSCPVCGGKGTVDNVNDALTSRGDKPLDVAAFVWLVRHEVAHWRGLKHKQMASTIRHWNAWKDAGRPLPSWAEGLTVAIDAAPPVRVKKPVPSADVEREKRVAHARAMLAQAEKKSTTAAMLVKRWTRRLGAADRAVQKAATKGAGVRVPTACMCGEIDPPRLPGDDGLERCIYCGCH